MPENKMLGSTRIDQLEPGNITVSVYIKTLNDLDIDIDFGDYIGYAVTENSIRYYSVANDGLKNFDNKHTIMGYKGAFRTITCAPIDETEFRGM
jgi:hypothetical protein